MAASLIAPMASLLIKPVASLLMNAITWKGVRRAAKGQEGKFLPLLALPLSNIEIIKYFNYEPTLNGVFQEIIYLE